MPTNTPVIARAKNHLRAHIGSFSKANATALAATAVDFSTLYTLVEYGHIYYVIATACAALAGAITNFSLNKFWAFRDGTGQAHVQGIKYALVSATSLLLNTGLVFCFTEFAGLRYLVSKVIAAVSVGWGWNYPLHRYFVFPPEDDTTEEREPCLNKKLPQKNLEPEKQSI